MQKAIGPILPQVRYSSLAPTIMSGLSTEVFPTSRNRKELLVSAVHNVIGTRKGERLMRPEFGCDLDLLVFEMADTATGVMGADFLQSAIEKWVPQASVLDISFEMDATNNQIVWNMSLAEKSDPNEVILIQIRR